jgi:putative transposase
MTVLSERLPSLPLTPACMALGLDKSTVYARPMACIKWRTTPALRKNSIQPKALTAGERATVVKALNGEGFADQSPKEVYQ